MWISTDLSELEGKTIAIVLGAAPGSRQVELTTLGGGDYQISTNHPAACVIFAVEGNIDGLIGFPITDFHLEGEGDIIDVVLKNEKSTCVFRFRRVSIVNRFGFRVLFQRAAMPSEVIDDLVQRGLLKMSRKDKTISIRVSRSEPWLNFTIGNSNGLAVVPSEFWRTFELFEASCAVIRHLHKMLSNRVC